MPQECGPVTSVYKDQWGAQDTIAALSLESSSALMLSGTVMRPRGFRALTSSSTVIFSFASFSRISAHQEKWLDGQAALLVCTAGFRTTPGAVNGLKV